MKNLLWTMILVSMVVLLIGCGASSAPAATAPPTAPPTATAGASLTVQDVQRIAPAEAKALLDSGEAILYDVRSEAAYSNDHAAGALSFPDSASFARFGELPTDISLVFY